jgi:hypothetical protein
MWRDQRKANMGIFSVMGATSPNCHDDLRLLLLHVLLTVIY